MTFCSNHLIVHMDELIPHTLLTINPGDRYNSEPKNFDDAFDEFDDKTNKRSSFRKFRDRAYSGPKTGGYRDDVSNKRYQKNSDFILYSAVSFTAVFYHQCFCFQRFIVCNQNGGAFIQVA